MKWRQEKSSNRTALCPPHLSSPLPPKRQRYITEKKHKKLHCTKQLSVVLGTQTIEKAMSSCIPTSMVTTSALTPHDQCMSIPSAGPNCPFSGKPAPEQPKPSPSLLPRKKVAGHRTGELFWWQKGLSLALGMHTVLFVVAVFFATEIQGGQGAWREQPPNLQQLGFVCLSRELERLDLKALLLSLSPGQYSSTFPSSRYLFIQYQKQNECVHHPNFFIYTPSSVTKSPFPKSTQLPPCSSGPASIPKPNPVLFTDVPSFCLCPASLLQQAPHSSPTFSSAMHSFLRMTTMQGLGEMGLSRTSWCHHTGSSTDRI